MKQGTLFTKIIFAVLLVALLAYIILAAFSAMKASITTVTALAYEAGEGLSTTGFVVRDETVPVSYTHLFTIEALARQYLMNPTTLKEVFKSVYGTSIAAHIKAHRMQRAAELLQMTSLSLAEIAQAVGYSSQGKFTAAFKAYYQVPPKAFKKHPPYQSSLPDCPCYK